MISRNRYNTGMGDTGAFQYALSWVLWPFLFVGCMSITAYGFSLDHPYLPFVFFNGAYFLLIVSLLWLAAVTAFIGMLTHCNVEMRFGALSWIFNTPEIHRWHHSRVLREGNTNYGENVMLWDHVFRTFFHEDRRPPARIGIHEHMPHKCSEQFIWPFLTKEKWQVISGLHKTKVQENDVADATEFQQAAE